MSIDQAREIIEKFYNDGEIMKQILIITKAPEKIRTGKKTTEEQQYRDFAEAAAEMGYHATPEEYRRATKDYLESIGSMNSIAKVFQIITVASELAKQTI